MPRTQQPTKRKKEEPSLGIAIYELELHLRSAKDSLERWRKYLKREFGGEPLPEKYKLLGMVKVRGNSERIKSLRAALRILRAAQKKRKPQPAKKSK